MSVSVEDIMQHSRIDYIDEEVKKDIEEKIEVARIYVDSCVGEEYKKNEQKLPLADLLVKKIVGDLFDNRDLRLNNKNNGYDQISTTILDVLSNCGE